MKMESSPVRVHNPVFNLTSVKCRDVFSSDSRAEVIVLSENKQNGRHT